MNAKVLETIKSRKFWAAIIAALIPVLNKELNLNLDTTTVLEVVGVITAWILAQAHVDNAKIIANKSLQSTIPEPVKPIETKVEPKSVIVETLDKQADELTRATTELWTIEKAYREGKTSLPITLASVEAWKKIYPSWSGLVPPGWPSI